MRAVHVVVPANIDDPTRPSGGNRYDRRLMEELTGLGWRVRKHRVGGSWPRPTPADVAVLDRVLADLPDRALVLVDGLIGSAAADVLVPATARLRVVVLLHMPLAEADPEDAVRLAEGDVLRAAAGVVTTSRWARTWTVRHHRLRPDRVRVAEPGVDSAVVARQSATGRELLCLSSVIEAKGHDVLVAALAQIADLDWRCTCVGAVDLEPQFVARLAETARKAGVADRIRLTGPLLDGPLAATFATADLLVSASRRESYGMAVTEALARGIPVLVTEVGGQAEAVGRIADGSRPGVLVPPDDPDRLAVELRRWLRSHHTRERLRSAAAVRRRGLADWAGTARRVATALQEAASPAAPSSPDTTARHR